MKKNSMRRVNLVNKKYRTNSGILLINYKISKGNEKDVVLSMQSCNSFSEFSLHSENVAFLTIRIYHNISQGLVIAPGCAHAGHILRHFFSPANIDTITDATVNHLIELLYYSLIKKNDFTSIRTCTFIYLQNTINFGT